MALILNIDTALQTASVCIGKNGVPLAFEKNTIQNQHASWLHSAIKNLVASSNINFSELARITVNSKSVLATIIYKTNSAIPIISHLTSNI
jgi:tRNA threonylcarbamoyladenosine biosynthesis protein TsaB